MKTITYRELANGDVYREGGRYYLVMSDPVTENGVTSFQVGTPAGRALGHAQGFSECDVKRWGTRKGWEAAQARKNR